MDVDFNFRRARTLARLCAYTLLGVFLINLLAAALPLPFGDPQRALALLTELVERSTLPAVAVLFLYLGLSGDALPAIWECHGARTVRLLSRVVAVLYLILAIVVAGLGQYLLRTGVTSLSVQVQSSIDGLQQLQERVKAQGDSADLLRLVGSQPLLQEGLRQSGVSLDRNASVRDQKQQIQSLIDRAKANLLLQAQKRQADAIGSLFRQVARIALVAVVYAFYYLAVGLIWPKSLGATIERVLVSRNAFLDGEEQEAGRDP